MSAWRSGLSISSLQLNDFLALSTMAHERCRVTRPTHLPELGWFVTHDCEVQFHQTIRMLEPVLLDNLVAQVPQLMSMKVKAFNEYSFVHCDPRSDDDLLDRWDVEAVPALGDLRVGEKDDGIDLSLSAQLENELGMAWLRYDTVRDLTEETGQARKPTVERQAFETAKLMQDVAPNLMQPDTTARSITSSNDPSEMHATCVKVPDACFDVERKAD